MKMGTDVYLEWSGMSEKDKKKQLTGFCINAGNVGYLRASIGMRSENSVLRKVFSEEFWKGKSLRFEFNEEGYRSLEKLGFIYLLSTITGNGISRGRNSGRTCIEKTTSSRGSTKSMSTDCRGFRVGP